MNSPKSVHNQHNTLSNNVCGVPVYSLSNLSLSGHKQLFLLILGHALQFLYHAQNIGYYMPEKYIHAYGFI